MCSMLKNIARALEGYASPWYIRSDSIKAKEWWRWSLSLFELARV